MPTGRTSLYLDIYQDGVRRYEYLQLYLEPGTGSAVKTANRETLLLAEAICAKRLVELRTGAYSLDEGAKRDTLLLPYFRHHMEKRPMTESSRQLWQNALRHLADYASAETTFRNVTPQWVQGFLDHLDTSHGHGHRGASSLISEGTRSLYYTKFKAVIHQAMKEGIIVRDPTLGISRYHRQESRRIFLSFEEVRRLAATPCADVELRRAFLFSCLTGLRRSDISALTWGEVSQQGSFTRLTFRQQKTGGQEYIDLTPQAVAFMGTPTEPTAHVFAMRYTAETSRRLQRWAADAGITKTGITFHSARHTFAVMMLELGADLYTVSKLLGHREIQTTQIYAHVIDKTKQAAALLVPSLT
jgi:site-specific recombinase XerD